MDKPNCKYWEPDEVEVEEGDWEWDEVCTNPKNKRGWCDFAWDDPKECEWYEPEGEE